ncbi:MAG: sigma-54 dependent transcriptional regulator [Syntrophorhabdales bacterium]|jgi:DNA-binding NtrC family response regulator
MLKVLMMLKNRPAAVLSVLKGHQVDEMDSPDPLLERVSHGNYHLVLAEGIAEMLPEIKAADPRSEVVLVGGNEADGVEAVKNGAFACLGTPLNSERLGAIVREIDSMVEMRSEMAHLEEQLDQKYEFAGIVGRNPKMLDIISFIRRIAPYYRVAMITGETGTGKEVIARALHDMSSRPEDPFVTSNCAGYVETLIESELFGHQKGSFTGAIQDKVGLFEAAKEGTLFLDEIGDLPLSFQPHLLRVLQNGEFRPVGSHRVFKSRCRVIGATSKDLKEEVQAGRFREDLFYRITPLVIHIPPLRERKDDIPLLSRFMLKRYREQTKKPVRGISRPAQDILLSHNWPGNVRELENVINQAVILTSDSFIGPSHFPAYMRGQKTKQTGGEGSSLDKVIKKHIEAVLGECQGNRSRAARKLGVSRRALLRKIDKYAIK